MAPIADGTPFQFGIYTFYFGRGIVELEDASNLSEQPEALRHQLERSGHLFIRNCHPQNTVETARDFTLEAIRQRGSLAPNTPLEQGIAAEPYKNFSFSVSSMSLMLPKSYRSLIVHKPLISISVC